MFRINRWTGVFFSISGENAEAVFLCLKKMATPVKFIHGAFLVYGASQKLEKILRESTQAAGNGNSQAVELAIRFICLLVMKKCFKYIDVLLEKIEHELDKKKGILTFILETAAPLDNECKKEFAQMFREKTQAADVRIKTCVKPELLGGYFLRAGSFYVDASIKGQVEKMSAELKTAAETMIISCNGGNNDKL